MNAVNGSIERMSTRGLCGVWMMWIAFGLFPWLSDPVPAYVLFLAGATLATHNPPPKP